MRISCWRCDGLVELVLKQERERRAKGEISDGLLSSQLAEGSKDASWQDIPALKPMEVGAVLGVWMVLRLKVNTKVPSFAKVCQTGT